MKIFEEFVPLKNYSNYKIGGEARYFFEAKNSDDCINALESAAKMKSPTFILGDGTNILFDDQGFDGLVLKPAMTGIKRDGEVLTVGAGISIDNLLDVLADWELAGLEWAGGLPGTLGGAVFGNAGCFGGEIKDIVKSVTSVSFGEGAPKIIKRKPEECIFEYRSSIFKKNQGKEIIIEVVLELSKGDRKSIKNSIEEKINYRLSRHPMEYPNIGSIFKNIPTDRIAKGVKEKFAAVVKTDPFEVIPTAAVIAETGLKGVSFGGAMISPKHPNFIVNSFNAASQDVKTLINLVKNEVKEKFDIGLEEEIIYV